MHTQHNNALTIGFVGGLRYFDINKRIIDIFGNSEEYNLLYVGKKHPGCDLEEYSLAKKISNIKFMPAYDNDDKPKIYENIDIINSVYGNDTAEVCTALPNKLYDAVLYKKPIMVSAGTYLQEVVDEYCLGLAVDLDKDDIEDELACFLSGFDKCLFYEGCERFLKIALEEKGEMLKQVDEFIKGMCRSIANECDS